MPTPIRGVVGLLKHAVIQVGQAAAAALRWLTRSGCRRGSPGQDPSLEGPLPHEVVGDDGIAAQGRDGEGPVQTPSLDAPPHNQVAGNNSTAATAGEEEANAVSVELGDMILVEQKDGLLLCLQAALTGSQGLDVQQQAVKALGRLVQADRGFAQSIAEMPAAVAALVLLLGSASAEAEEDAITPLAWMAYWLPGSRASMVQQPGLVDGLMKVLGSSSTNSNSNRTAEAQALAAGAIADLAHEICEVLALDMRQAIHCSLAAILASSGSSFDVQQQAARALANMACNASNAHSIIETERAVEGLVALLSSTAAEVQEEAVAALQHLVAQVTGHRAAMARRPLLVEGLVQVMGSSSSSAAKAAAASAIADLAQEPSNLELLLRQEGLLGSLVALLGSSDMEGQQEAARALGNLAASKAVACAIAALPSATAGLVALLKGGSAAAQEVAAAALGNLSHWEGSRRAIVVQLSELQLVPILVAVMGSTNSSSMAKELALGVVADLSWEPSTWPLLSQQQPLIPRLVVLLGDTSPTVQHKAVHVLAQLAQHSAISAECIVQSYALPGLVRVLRKGQGQAQEAAAAALAWLPQWTAEARRKMSLMQHLVPGLMHVLGSVSSTPAAQQCAAAVVAGLAQDGYGASISPDLVLCLVQLLGSSNPGMQQQAAAALGSLAGHMDENTVQGAITRLMELGVCEAMDLDMDSAAPTVTAASAASAADMEAGACRGPAGAASSGASNLCHVAPPPGPPPSNLCDMEDTSPWTVRQWAAAALCQLTLTQNGAAVIRQQSGGVQFWLSQLGSSSRPVQLAAATALGHLTADGDSTTWQHVADSSLDGLVAVLSSSIRPETQEAAVKVLDWMAHILDTADKIAGKDKAIRCLVALLGSSSAGIQRRAANMLSRLPWGSNTAQHVAMEDGAMDRLVALLSSSTSEVQAAAAGALHSLAIYYPNIVKHTRQIVAAVDGLVALYRSSTPEVQTAAAWALSWLAWSSSVSEQIASTAGMFGHLVKALSSSPSVVLLPSASLLTALSIHEKARQSLAAAPTSVQDLIQLLSSSNSDPAVLYAATAVVASLACGANTRPVVAAAPGAIEGLLASLSNDNSSSHVRRKAATGLVSLACDGSATTGSTTPHTQAVVKGLTALVTSSSTAAEVQEVAVAALQQLAANLVSGRAAMAQEQQLLEGLVRMMGSNSLLGSSAAQAAAASAIADLAQEPSNLELLLRQEGLLVSLVALLGSSNMEGQQEAARALGNLFRWPSSRRGSVVQLPDLLPTLVTMLGSSSSSSMAQELAVRAVADLSWEPSTWPLLSQQQPLIPRLVALLGGGGSSSSSPAVQGKAVQVLAQLAQHHADSAGLIVAGGALPGLARLLKEGQGQVQEAATAALAWLAHQTNSTCFSMSYIGDLVPGLMHLLRSNSSTSAAQECAAAVVAALARGRYGTLLDTDLIPCMGEVLNGSNPQVQLQAAATLSGPAGDWMCKDTVAQPPVISRLMRLVDSEAAGGGQEAKAAAAVADMAARPCHGPVSSLCHVAPPPGPPPSNLCDMEDTSPWTVREWAAAALCQLTLTQQGAASMQQQNGVQFWVRQLSSSSPRVQLAAARALGYMAVGKITAAVHGKIRQSIADAAGVVDGLEALLLSSSRQEVLAEAAGALDELARHPDIGQQIIARDKVIKRLVVVLDSSSTAGVQRHAASVLGWLALHHEDNARQIGSQHGAIEPLVALLSSSMCEVQAAAATALDRLATCPSNLQQIAAKDGVVDRLMTLLIRGTPEVQAAAARVLHQLASHPDIAEQIASKKDAIHSLVVLLSSSCFWVRWAAGHLLITLSCDDKARQQLAAAEGDMGVLASLLNSNDLAQLRPAVMVVASLACDANTRPVVAAAPGAIEGLLASLSNDNSISDVRWKAATGLVSLACDGSTTTGSTTPHTQAVVKGLTALVTSSSTAAEVQEVAVAALQQLAAKVASGRAAMAQEQQLLEGLVRIMGSNSLLGSSAAQAAAASAIADLAQEPSNLELLLRQEGLLGSLLALLGSSNMEGQREAARALGNLFRWPSSSRGSVVQLPDLLPTLVTMLGSSSSSSMVRELAVRAVADLSWEPSTWPLLSQQQPLIPRLVALLGGGGSNPGLEKLAADALGALMGGQRSTIELIAGMNGVVEGLVALLGCTSGDRSSSRKSSCSSLRVQAIAAYSLANLATSASGAQRISGMHGAIKGLVQKLSSTSDAVVQAHVARALANLAGDASRARYIAEMPEAMEILTALSKSNSSLDVQREAAGALGILQKAKAELALAARRDSLEEEQHQYAYRQCEEQRYGYPHYQCEQYYRCVPQCEYRFNPCEQSQYKKSSCRRRRS